MTTERTRADDRGSLPMALLISLIGVSLSTILATQVLTQFSTTRTSSAQDQALSAAQAGVDIALARIRAATSGVDSDGNPQGSLAKLPCAQFTGRIADAGNARYRVRITYLGSDPRGRDDAWLDNPGNYLTCGASGPSQVPLYALVRSDGTDVPTGDVSTVAHRSLRATYTFKTTNKNIPGGLVYINRVSNSLSLCLSSAQNSSGIPTPGEEYPASGTLVKMQGCAPGDPTQTWAYDENLRLVLTSTIGRPTSPNGMCVDGGYPHPTSSTNPKVKVRFQPCLPVTTTSNRVRQMWSLNDASNFQGTTNGTSLNGLCLRVASINTPGSDVEVNSCSGAANQVNWSLDATVGAGMASGSNNRLVNYKQFGRCADVTDFKEDAAFLIVWPCKQLPDGSVAWNQSWQWPAVTAPAVSSQGSISTYSTDTTANGGQRWLCLNSPGATGFGVYVRLTPCTPSGPPAAARWTIYGDTRFDADPANNALAYAIVDYRGYCLTPRSLDADPADLFPATLKISKLQVAPCDGTTLQKWNAPASFNQRSPLKDINEVLG